MRGPYRKQMPYAPNLKSIETTIGEHIETKVMRIQSENEPIKDGAPIIYTDRKDGVQPAYNIRTDRFEVATEAMDSIHRAEIAKTEGKPETKVIDLKPDNSGGGDDVADANAGKS